MKKFFIPLLLIVSCTNTTNKQKTSFIPSDTTQAFKIENYWIAPKPSLGYNSVLNTSNDTIDLAVCSDYIYYPLGKLNDTSSIRTGTLKNFKKSDTLVEFPNNEKILCYKLVANTNKLLLWFDKDVESVVHSYILGGEINDSTVTLTTGAVIGQTKNHFLSLYFDYFPEEIAAHYNTFIFETCVTGLRNVYTFKDEKLYKISFQTNVKS